MQLPASCPCSSFCCCACNLCCCCLCALAIIIVSVVVVAARVKVISGKCCAATAAAWSCAVSVGEWEKRWATCFSGLDAARFSGFYLTLLLPYRNMQHVESTNCILAQSLSRWAGGAGRVPGACRGGRLACFLKYFAHTKLCMQHFK